MPEIIPRANGPLWGWQDDGSFEPDIQTVNEQLADIMPVVVPLEYYRNSGDDDQTALNNAINAVSDGATIRFQQGKTYVLTSFTLSKCVTLDFNGAIIQANTSGVLITLNYTSGDDTKPSKKLLRGIFQNYSGVTPTDILKVDGAINPVIDCIFSNITTSHSIIWNYASYGLRGKQIIHWCNSPQAILFSANSSTTAYSYDFDIDPDISNHSGIGIIIQGGDGKINGVIESCSLGGILFDGTWNLVKLDIGAYFEANSQFDIKLDNGSNIGAGITVKSKFIGSNTYNKIMLGSNIKLTAMNCFYQYGGVVAINTGSLGSTQYIGINNVQSQVTTGFTNNSEIADNILNVLKFRIINQIFTYKPTPPTWSGISTNGGVTGTLTLISSTLKAQAKNDSNIDYFVYTNQYDFTPSATGQSQFTINVPSGYVLGMATSNYDTAYNNSSFEKTAIHDTGLQIDSTSTIKHRLFVTALFFKA